MDVTNVTASVGTSASSAGTAAAINGQDFMKILLTQLQYQDPLKPMDNQQMVQQMATIRELEMNTNLATKLTQLTDQQRFGAAAALIGKHVKGTVSDENGHTFAKEGKVKSVQFTSKGDVILDLDSGDQLPLANLEEVSEPAATASTSTTNQQAATSQQTTSQAA